MQTVISWKDLAGYEDYIHPRAFEKIQGGRVRRFESGRGYMLLSLSLEEAKQEAGAGRKLLIYFDEEDLIFLCSSQSLSRMQGLAETMETNEHTLWLFFQNLLKNDIEYLEELEGEITDAEMAAMVRYRAEDLRGIIGYRKQLLRMKRYYEQLADLFGILVQNEASLLTVKGVGQFQLLQDRVDSYLVTVLNLRDYVTQVRETYQAQLDIEQNGLMRVFTVVTAIFLPLTLMAGWYGMNFSYMPELGSPIGYPVFVCASLLVCGGLLFYFKKKKWI